MARCNLLLSRATRAGGRRTHRPAAAGQGVALDPVAMQRILTAELGYPIRVDGCPWDTIP